MNRLKRPRQARSLSKQAGFAVILVYLALAAVIVASATGFYFKVVGDAYDRGQSELMIELERTTKERRALERERITVASKGRENDRVQIRTRYKTLTETVIQYVQTDPARAGVICLPDEQLRNVNEALTNGRTRADRPKPAAGVPGPDAASSRDGGRGGAEAGRTR